MSLLKWKEMAEKKSDLGKQINSVRNTIKQKSITDQMGEVEAEKLFKPITSGLRELAKPKLPLRRLVKKSSVPDYNLEIGDDEDGLDYSLEDLFGDEIQPQNNKQLVPKPPSYEDVLDDIASGKKQIYIDPENMPAFDDLPPEYEYEEGPDYAIIDEDRINQALDKLDLANYDDIELRLNQAEMNDTKRKSYIKKILKKAKKEKSRLPGFSTDITNRLKKGLINQADAQKERKVIIDTRTVLKNYINHLEKKLTTSKGSGFKKRGGRIQFFNNPTEMIKKLELIIGSISAGNNSIQMRNDGVNILDILLRNSIINKPQYNKIYKNYFNVI